MIDPGKMRERVTVQIATGTTNALGEAVMVWSDSTSVWASVDGVSSREQLLFGQNQIAISHRVMMRYLPGLTQSMRFSWRGRTLEIMSLLDHANRSEHEAMCQENV